MKVINSQLAFQQLRRVISLEVEEVWALALRANKSLIQAQCIFRGSVDSCLFHPRDIFRFACSSNAAGIVVAHSHPSGDPFPSEQDLIITQKLQKASWLLEIPLIDHLVITQDAYKSFVDEGWLEVEFADETSPSHQHSLS